AIYTDNQPDFSFLAPGETRTFSQYWYPIRSIGVPQAASLRAAMSLRVEDRTAHIGVCVTEGLSDACLLLRSNGDLISEWRQSISVAEPLVVNASLAAGVSEDSLSVTLEHGGRCLLQFAPGKVRPSPRLPRRLRVTTNSTSPACTCSSTATPRAAPCLIGVRLSVVIPAMLASTPRLARGTSSVASLRTPKRIC